MQDRSLDQQLGRYQQVATLGQGGMGTVHLVLASGFAQFRKLLVIKELRQDLTCQKGFVRLFMDEAKLAARLAHPNVVQTFEAFQEGNRYLLAMEYLDGQALSALTMRLACEGVRMPLGMHVHILCEVLSGLHYAHELRDYDSSPLHVVHRDVSPQNVFLTYHGAVKVVDFGVAKAANAALSNVPGLFVGKFAYAAPEQISGQPVDARTDVFAVGIMLWQALAERRFSLGTPTPEAKQARAEGAEPRIRELVPDVDPMLADICDRAIEVDPNKRYASAQAFRAALQSYVEARDIHVHDAEIAELMTRMFAADRDTLHTQIEAVVEASRQSQSKVDSMTNDEREPTTKVDLSRAPEVTGQHASDEHAELSNVVRVSAPPDSVENASVNAALPGPRKRVVRAGVLSLGALALGTLLWLNSRLDPPGDVETRLLPATLVTPSSQAAAHSAASKTAPPSTASVRSANAPHETARSANAPTASTLSEGPRDSSNSPQRRAANAGSVERQAPARVDRASLPLPTAAPSRPAANSGNWTRAGRRSQQLTRAAAARAEDAPGDAPPPSPSAATASSPAEVEVGADLGVLHRGVHARIDVENPY